MLKCPFGLSYGQCSRGVSTIIYLKENPVECKSVVSAHLMDSSVDEGCQR